MLILHEWFTQLNMNAAFISAVFIIRVKDYTVSIYSEIQQNKWA